MPQLDRGHLAQLATAALGIWLMASPDVLGYGDPLATSDHVAGPLFVTLGGIAIWEVNRGARFAAIPLAVWLLFAPWILDAGLQATLNNMLVGAAVGILALVRGEPADAFGGGWSALWANPSVYRDRTEENPN